VKVAQALLEVERIFLDSAPVIYFVENHPAYAPVLSEIFRRIDSGQLLAVTSPITLAECLVLPIRQGLTQLEANFQELIVRGNNTLFTAIDHSCAWQAAKLRAQYNITLADALQIATAMRVDCDAFLTNDAALLRVQDVKVLLVENLEL
jgi:predicted nucleic acid-binding protein